MGRFRLSPNFSAEFTYRPRLKMLYLKAVGRNVFVFFEPSRKGCPRFNNDAFWTVRIAIRTLNSIQPSLVWRKVAAKERNSDVVLERVCLYRFSVSKDNNSKRWVTREQHGRVRLTKKKYANYDIAILQSCNLSYMICLYYEQSIWWFLSAKSDILLSCQQHICLQRLVNI